MRSASARSWPPMMMASVVCKGMVECELRIADCEVRIDKSGVGSEIRNPHSEIRNVFLRFRVSEPAQRVRVFPPGLVDLHVQLQKNPGAQQRFDGRPGCGADA